MRDRFERKLNARQVAQKAGIQVVSEGVPRAKLADRMHEHIPDAASSSHGGRRNQPSRGQGIPIGLA